jgi:hypothetical protein
MKEMSLDLSKWFIHLKNPKLFFDDGVFPVKRNKAKHRCSKKMPLCDLFLLIFSIYFVATAARFASSPSFEFVKN